MDQEKIETALAEAKAEIVQLKMDAAHIKANVKPNRLRRLLKMNIALLRIVAVISLALSIGFAAYVYWDIKNLLDPQIKLLKEAPNPGHTLAYLIYRITTLSAIAGFILYIGFKITFACYDQSLRFTKRRMGTAFLMYVQKKYHDISIDQLMSAFEAWNKTVESAFSSVKTDNPPSTNINLNLPEKPTDPPNK
jgi:hypothetical protein